MFTRLLALAFIPPVATVVAAKAVYDYVYSDTEAMNDDDYLVGDHLVGSKASAEREAHFFAAYVPEKVASTGAIPATTNPKSSATRGAIGTSKPLVPFIYIPSAKARAASPTTSTLAAGATFGSPERDEQLKARRVAAMAALGIRLASPGEDKTATDSAPRLRPLLLARKATPPSPPSPSPKPKPKPKAAPIALAIPAPALKASKAAPTALLAVPGLAIKAKGKAPAALLPIPAPAFKPKTASTSVLASFPAPFSAPSALVPTVTVVPATPRKSRGRRTRL